ncbi:MAG: hypothetical protein JXR11_06850 [Balneola sp.]
MKRILKYFLLVLGGIFVLNLLSWFFYGQEQILLVGANVEEVESWIDKTDTLYLFIGEVDYDNYKQFSDFNSSTVEKLVTKIHSTGRTVIIDERPLPMHVKSDDGKELLNSPDSNAYSYDVQVVTPFPLVAKVYKLIWVPGFGTDREHLYIWFFKWFCVKDLGGGVS